MALSQADLNRIDAAIASGVLRVSVDGVDVTYPSIEALLRAREHIAGALAITAGTVRIRRVRFGIESGVV